MEKIFFILTSFFMLSVAFAQEKTQDAVLRLSKGIQFKTVSATNTTKETEIEFKKYQAFLKAQYPLTFKTLSLHLIGNTICLKWPGVDLNSKPYLFLAHQDVVPVDDADTSRWTKPAFSGEIFEQYIWGRGTLDDKSSVQAILEAVESLIQNHFVPKTTFYFAFGHDEEIGGKSGQKLLAAWFQNQNIRFDSVFDEGMAMIKDLFPEIENGVALIGVAEKGYLSLKIKVHAKGGHSSIPSSDNAILKLSAILLKINQKQFPKTMHSIAQNFLEKIATHIPGLRGFFLRHPKMFSKILVHEMEKDPTSAALLGTTTAVTMIKSGVKDNILPNLAEAVLNFRILPGMSSDDVVEHIKNTINDSSVEIEKLTESESSSVSPSSISETINSHAFKTLETTIRSNFPGAVVVPSIVLASTDSKHYHHLTNQIYRFAPLHLNKKDLSRIHGIDERILVENYLQMISFYKGFIKAL